MNKMARTDDVEKEIDIFSDSYSLNTFRGEIIFKLFNNINTIQIMTTNSNGSWEYKFSFKYLLLLICDGSYLKKIIIKAIRDRSSEGREGSDSWLCKLWRSFDNESLLCSIFVKQQFKVYFKTMQRINDAPNTRIEECIIIEKE